MKYPFIEQVYGVETAATQNAEDLKHTRVEKNEAAALDDDEVIDLSILFSQTNAANTSFSDMSVEPKIEEPKRNVVENFSKDEVHVHLVKNFDELPYHGELLKKFCAEKKEFQFHGVETWPPPSSAAADHISLTRLLEFTERHRPNYQRPSLVLTVQIYRSESGDQINGHHGDATVTDDSDERPPLAVAESVTKRQIHGDIARSVEICRSFLI
ncbi:OLC1v1035951C1 [Oldenlandia corymbosa var. corymbosa]|uniref:OLC1v1035951C1 n=1 Tax=Oldenlandia corymbosa var. corymbosa TaxID=529605 RepID=A0AAV1CUS4_OLDCO|nr:OLC1v1035951C1 [Oldenlandia corymbosa var. corymbosa]